MRLAIVSAGILIIGLNSADKTWISSSLPTLSGRMTSSLAMRLMANSLPFRSSIFPLGDWRTTLSRAIFIIFSSISSCWITCKMKYLPMVTTNRNIRNKVSLLIFIRIFVCLFFITLPQIYTILTYYFTPIQSKCKNFT